MENIDTNLEYKEHGNFFEFYFTYSKKAHELCAFAITDQRHLLPAVQGVYLLATFTSNYISDYEKIKERINECFEDLKRNTTKDTVNKISTILTDISRRHEESGLLPKKIKEEKVNEEIWRKQNDVVLKTVLKGCSDYLYKQ